MSIYYSLYVMFFALAVLINYTVPKFKRKNILTIALFFLIWIILALRHPSMGIDLGYGKYGVTGYLNSFLIISKYTWKQIFSLNSYLNYENGYIILNKLIGLFTDSYQVFLGIIALISIVPVCYIVMKKSINPLQSVIVYMGLPVFLILFSGLRQGIAIAFCFYSITFIQRKKTVKFILIVLFASLFHSSALVFLPSYLIYNIKLSKPKRFILSLFFPITFILRYTLFNALIKMFGYNVKPDYNNAITLFVILCLIYLFCVFYMDDEQDNGYLNLFFVACLFQSIGGIYSTVLRMGYYFMIPLILLLPQTLSNIHEKRTKIIINIIVMVCFIYSGLDALSDSSWALSNPYYWFWESIYQW